MTNWPGRLAGLVAILLLAACTSSATDRGDDVPEIQAPPAPGGIGGPSASSDNVFDLLGPLPLECAVNGPVVFRGDDLATVEQIFGLADRAPVRRDAPVTATKDHTCEGPSPR